MGIKGVQPSVGGTIPKHVLMEFIRKQTKKARRSKPISSVLP